ncbi:MAG: putative DNA repair protein MutK [bacterium]
MPIAENFMATSLLVLLDDIASILDDVAVMTKIATKKTAGVLGDDLALNAQQVTGVKPDRELPVVWAVAKGSAWNKAILVPIALLISAVAPWAITPLLMLGGLYLCFEGVEKLSHKFLHPEAAEEQRKQLIERVTDQEIDLVDMEKDKIKGAIRTDFVLSAEIIVITLGTASSAAFSVQVATLVVISAIMTIGVYGLVAGIVKLDDAGLHLSQPADGSTPNSVSKAIGTSILWFAPLLMKFLSVVGTAAMFIVGGGILTHGVHWLAESIKTAALGVSGLPVFSDLKGVGSFAEQITTTLLNTAVGILAGIAALVLFTLFQKIRGKTAH